MSDQVELVGGPMDGAVYGFDSYDPFILVCKDVAGIPTYSPAHSTPEPHAAQVTYVPDWVAPPRWNRAGICRHTPAGWRAYRFNGYPRGEKVRWSRS